MQDKVFVLQDWLRTVHCSVVTEHSSSSRWNHRHLILCTYI